MKLENLNHWSGITANVCVIAGMVFLAIELNQNSMMMAAQTRTNVTQEILYLLEMERDPVVREAFRKGNSGEELNQEQYSLLANTLTMRLRHWENVFYQYEKGLFNQAEFGGIFSAIERDFQYDIMKDTWNQQQEMYSTGFRELIDTLVD